MTLFLLETIPYSYYQFVYIALLYKQDYDINFIVIGQYLNIN